MNQTLSMDKEEMRQLGYQAVDMIVEHIASLADKPATNQKSRKELESIFREEIPEEGSDPKEVFKMVEKDVFSHIMHLDHPRFFAFVPGPSNYISVLADFLATGFNVFAGTWLEASAPAQIELVTIQWLTRLFHLPETAGGLFVSGGSIANLMSVILTLHHKKNEEGVGVIYCSDQTHSSVQRAVHIVGKAQIELRKIAVDEEYRIPTETLKSAIQSDTKNGRQPLSVIANAGTTNTGTVDDLDAIARICKQENLWFHIDGAYGGFGILDERQKHLFRGIEKADSLSIDPHKWLFQPYETGCLLVRDQNLLKEVFYILPEYLKDTDLSEEEINYGNYGLQLTRGFRAFKVWLSMKTFGLNSFVEAVKRGIDLAELAEKEVKRYKNWKVISPAQLGIINFRYQMDGLDYDRTNALNQAIINEMVKSGFSMISSTQLHGQLVIRLCMINPRTTDEDVIKTVNKLNKIAQRMAAPDKS